MRFGSHANGGRKMVGLGGGFKGVLDSEVG